MRKLEIDRDFWPGQGADIEAAGDKAPVFANKVSKYLIKRVIGLPGERVILKGGKVSVNGKELNLIEENISAGVLTHECDVITPNDGFFVLSESPEDTTDSRTLGAILKGEIFCYMAK